MSSACTTSYVFVFVFARVKNDSTLDSKRKGMAVLVKVCPLGETNRKQLVGVGHSEVSTS